jgi:hypothetical protein
MSSEDVEFGGNDVMEVDRESHQVPSLKVSSARKGRNSFPLSEIEEKSPHFKCVYQALSKVVREKGISELDPASQSTLCSGCLL